MQIFYTSNSAKKHGSKKCIFKKLKYIEICYQENIDREVFVAWIYTFK